MSAADVDDWEATTAVHPVSPVDPNGTSRFGAEIGPAWHALQGLNGGVVAAVAVRATEAVLAAAGVVGPGAGGRTTLRAATFGYVSTTSPGGFEVEVVPVRRGRSLVTSHVRIVQAGATTMVGRLHHSSPWDGPSYSDAPPMPERPADTVALRGNERAAHFDRVETVLHPATVPFGGAGRAEWLAWSRPRGGGRFDSVWLTMFGDYFPPTVFARTTGPSRAVSVEYALQVHDAAGAWTLPADQFLTARMHAFHSSDGFAVEDGHLYLPDGTLLATTRQTRLAG